MRLSKKCPSDSEEEGRQENGYLKACSRTGQEAFLHRSALLNPQGGRPERLGDEAQEEAGCGCRGLLCHAEGMGLPRSAEDTKDLGQRLFQHAFYIVLRVHCDRAAGRPVGAPSQSRGPRGLTRTIMAWMQKEKHRIRNTQDSDCDTGCSLESP